MRPPPPALLLALLGVAAAVETVVQLPHGRGVVRGALSGGGGARAFRGIPYAQSPTGELRWRPPQPARRWAGTLDATRAGPSCMQAPGFSPPIYHMSEDCLSLSVYTPPSEKSAEGPHAVMVWLHGGSFTGGGANETRLDGSFAVSALGDSIIVVAQYRLGIFGWLGSEQLRGRDPRGSTGNYGLLDQRLALTWVRDNIAAFGGDPERVLLMGQSAGAASVSAHLSTEGSVGLFHRAAMSSSGFVDWNSGNMAAAEEMFDECLLRAGCANASCLETASADLLRNISGALGFRGDPTGGVESKGLSGGTRWGGTANPPGWGPIVDGVELRAAPERILGNDTLSSKTSIGKVPIIIGWARDEGGGFAGPIPGRNASTRDLSEQEFGLWAQLEWDLTKEETAEMKRAYVTARLPNETDAPIPAGPPFHGSTTCDGACGNCAYCNCGDRLRCRRCTGAWWAYARAMTDQSMACAARRAARAWAGLKMPVFMFSFDHLRFGFWNYGCNSGNGLSHIPNPGDNVTKDYCAPHREPRVPMVRHADDIPFWFMSESLLDTHCVGYEGELVTHCPGQSYDAQSKELARQMAGMWSSFAKTGVPGGGWPRWDDASQKVFHLRARREGGMSDHAMEKAVECRFWDKWEGLAQ